MGKGWMSPAAPFGNDDVLTEGTREAGIIRGGRAVPDAAEDKGVATGVTGGND